LARIFISHSSQDNATAAELKVWLNARGFEHIFLDFDESGGIQPGAAWEKTLYREIERAQAVIVVVTEHWMASKWCFAEFCQARALGKAIFPLIVGPTGESIVGADLQSIDLVSDREGGMQRLNSALLRIALQSPEAFELPRSVIPFPGLTAFGEDHAAVFFGRDSEITKLFEKLRHRRTTGGNNIFLVLGASGSGKSSFLRAGIVPRLKRDRSNFIVCPPFRPEAEPGKRLTEILLAELFRRGGNKASSSKRSQRLREALNGSQPTEALSEIAHDIRRDRGTMDASIVLLIDQAEEIFTDATPDGLQAFFRLLGALQDPALPFLIVATIRSDYLPRLQRMPDFSASYDLFPLDPMPLERVGALIRGPARLVGLEVDEEMVSAVTKDAKTDDALPLIAFVLRRLYDTFGPRQIWTLALYESLGNRVDRLSPLENAIRTSAEEALMGASIEQSQAVKAAFIPALVRLSADGFFVRRPERLSSVPDAARPFIARLIIARLLVARGNHPSSDVVYQAEGGLPLDGTVVEVAHEALFKVWPRLEFWLREERDFLAGKARIELALSDWNSLPFGEREKGLLSGILLERCTAWLADSPRRFSDEERAFIDASKAIAAKETARKLRQRSMLTVAFAAAAVFFFVGASVAVWLYRAERQQAEIATTEAATATREKNKALAAVKVVQSKDAIENGQMEEASRLALEALKIEPSDETRSALITAAMKISPYLESIRTLPGPSLEAIAWREDGEIAVVNREGGLSTLQLRDIADLTPHDVPGNPASNFVVDAFPLGNGIMGVTSDGSSVFVDGKWRTSERFNADGQTYVVPGPYSVASSKDGRYTAVATYDGVIFRECAPPSREEESLRCMDRTLRVRNPVGVALGADGQKLAVASDTGSLLIASDTRSGTLVQLKLSFVPVALDWSNANGLLLAADREGNIYRLTMDPDLGAAQAVILARGASGAMMLRWSPKGDAFAYVCRGNRICIVPITSEVSGADDPPGPQSVELVGHSATITKIAWSTDGERLASVSVDNQLRIWNRTANRGVQYSLLVSPRPLLSIAVDHISGVIAAGDDAGTVWAGDGSKPLGMLWQIGDLTRAPVASLAFATDGSLAALFEGEGVAVGNIKQAKPRYWAVSESGEMHFLAWTRSGKVAVTALRSLDLGIFDKKGVQGDAPTWPSKEGRGITPWGLTSSPVDGQLFISYTDGSIWRWDPDGAALLVSFVASEATPSPDTRTRGSHSLDISPNGKCLATSRSNGDVAVFDMTGRTILTLKTSDLSPKAVAFSADSRRLAAVSASGQVYMWDVGGDAQKLFETSVRGRRSSNDGGQPTETERAFAIAWLTNDRIGIATEAGSIEVIASDEHSWEKRVIGVLGEVRRDGRADTEPSSKSAGCNIP
jgi:WD40 repeat protein